MPKYKKNSSIQSNVIENSDQNTSVSTFANQHSIQGIHGNIVQGISGGGSLVEESNLIQAQDNNVPNSNQDSSVSTFENQNSIQGLDKMNGGGSCSVVNNVLLPCVQVPNINTPTCAPVLSQSELAFDSRYHTSNNSVNKSVLNQNGGNKKNKKNQDGSGYYLDLTERIGGLPNVQNVFDPKPPKYSPKYYEASQYNQPSCQSGGAYNFIINPESGRKVKLNGKIGKQILKNYLKFMNGGSETSVFTDDMSKRKFDCNQPYWNNSCV